MRRTPNQNQFFDEEVRTLKNPGWRDCAEYEPRVAMTASKPEKASSSHSDVRPGSPVQAKPKLTRLENGEAYLDQDHFSPLDEGKTKCPNHGAPKTAPHDYRMMKESCECCQGRCVPSIEIALKKTIKCIDRANRARKRRDQERQAQEKGNSDNESQDSVEPGGYVGTVSNPASSASGDNPQEDGDASMGAEVMSMDSDGANPFAGTEELPPQDRNPYNISNIPGSPALSVPDFGGPDDVEMHDAAAHADETALTTEERQADAIVPASSSGRPRPDSPPIRNYYARTTEDLGAMIEQDSPRFSIWREIMDEAMGNPDWTRTVGSLFWSSMVPYSVAGRDASPHVPARLDLVRSFR